MTGERPTGLHRVAAALVLLLAVAGAARLAFDWLAPLVPFLAALLLLLAVYAVAVRGVRR